jgi:hypothetical protein
MLSAKEFRNMGIPIDRNAFWYDHALLSEAIGEALFSNELNQLLIMAEDYNKRLQALSGSDDLEEYLDLCGDYSALSVKAMTLLLNGINENFDKKVKL